MLHGATPLLLLLLAFFFTLICFFPGEAKGTGNMSLSGARGRVRVRRKENISPVPLKHPLRSPFRRVSRRGRWCLKGELKVGMGL